MLNHFLLISTPRSQHGSVVQRKTYPTPIVQGNGGTHFFLKYWGLDTMDCMSLLFSLARKYTHSLYCTYIDKKGYLPDPKQHHFLTSCNILMQQVICVLSVYMLILSNYHNKYTYQHLLYIIYSTLFFLGVYPEKNTIH